MKNTAPGKGLAWALFAYLHVIIGSAGLVAALLNEAIAWVAPLVALVLAAQFARRYALTDAMPLSWLATTAFVLAGITLGVGVLYESPWYVPAQAVGIALQGFAYEWAMAETRIYREQDA